MTTIAANQAATELGKLLEKVRAGETVILTDEGKPIAHLVPPPEPRTDRDSAGRIREWFTLRKGLTLGGLSVRELIEEGRR